MQISSLVEDGDGWEERLEALFNERGMWRREERPVAWPSPEESAQSRQFWTVFEACLDLLPEKAARGFMMREFLGFDSDEICEQVAITTTNCHVILHRVRLRLRECIENGWGRPESSTC